MTYIQTVSPSAAEGRLKEIYDTAQKRAGEVANIVKMMSLDTDVCDTSVKFYVATMRTPNVLDRPTRELLATVVSHANDCFY